MKLLSNVDLNRYWSGYLLTNYSIKVTACIVNAALVRVTLGRYTKCCIRNISQIRLMITPDIC